jgi:membrane-associated protease RseP (regulator of RpoE activity)
VVNDVLGVRGPTVETFDVMIMSDPILMKLGHSLSLSEPLSPFADLGPIAFAGWVGCLITSINLLPIGQLDGGHIVNALFPKMAERISKGLLGGVFVYGLFTWKGWMVWSLLLWFMGAVNPVWVPVDSELSPRAKMIAGLAAIVFVMCVMSEPIYSETIAVADIVWVEK